MAPLLPSVYDLDRFTQVARLAAAMDRRLEFCDRRSLSIAFMQAARDGLLPDGRESVVQVYADRRGNGLARASYQRMLAGWLKLLHACPDVHLVDAQAVYAGDDFVVDHDPTLPIHHRPNVKSERGAVTHYWAQARLANGLYLKEVLTDADLEQIRLHAPAPDSPAYLTWRTEMGRRSAVKRLAKRLPTWRDPEASPLPLTEASSEPRVVNNPETLFALESDAFLGLNDCEDLDHLKSVWLQITAEYSNQRTEPSGALIARYQARLLELDGEKKGDSSDLPPGTSRPTAGPL
jgi:hypothetical protein